MWSRYDVGGSVMCESAEMQGRVAVAPVAPVTR
jgi:hypothetical protein